MISKDQQLWGRAYGDIYFQVSDSCVNRTGVDTGNEWNTLLCQLIVCMLVGLVLICLEKNRQLSRKGSMCGLSTSQRLPCLQPSELLLGWLGLSCVKI